MSDIKLFKLSSDPIHGESIELPFKTAALEKDLQCQIEAHMDTFLGVRFLATEYHTGKTHKGRIDSLGLDENSCPVIIEYKRHTNENVINQGLFYLDWLLDHQAEFRWLVMEKLGREVADNIEWSGTRLICIASDFNKYDEHAVQQINRNIELMRYRYFGEELLLLELVNAQSSIQPIPDDYHAQPASVAGVSARTVNKKDNVERNDLHQNRKLQASAELMSLYDTICDYAESLGDEVLRNELKYYTAFKRIKNFVSVQIWAPKQDPSLRLYLKLNPDDVELVEGKINDVRNKGHWGTGNLEVIVRTLDDLNMAKTLIEKSYQEN